MGLVLTEIATGTSSRSDVERLLGRVADAVPGSGGSLVEAQISQDLKQMFVVVEHDNPDALASALEGLGESRSAPAPVRLVGATLDAVRARANGATYLVEWDLPVGLSMDTYLARKKEKSPLYAQVPEVTFLRTYVREDMGKCLCFYQAPDEEAVRRAREAVSTPIDRLHRLASPTAAASDTQEARQ